MRGIQEAQVGAALARASQLLHVVGAVVVVAVLLPGRQAEGCEVWRRGAGCGRRAQHLACPAVFVLQSLQRVGARGQIVMCSGSAGI